MTNSKEYKNFFFELKKKFRDAQYEALKVVYTHLINLYWDLGRMNVEKQSSLLL